ncbi:MAG: rhomboid family intramembrane serine protease [Myxococcota bacterium]
MRMLHIFEEERDAQVLVDALFVEGVQATVRETRDDQWALWVHDEERMDDAKALLDEMLANPDDPKFASRQQEAKAARKEIVREEKRSRHREMLAREKLKDGLPLVTLGLIGMSLGMFFLVMQRDEIGRAMVPHVLASPFGFEFVESLLATASEPWRLVFPIFVHGGIFHLLFNLFWLRDFGSTIERFHSSGMLFLMTLVFGIGGVIGELTLAGRAVGMSGVVYGLFGYIWMRGRYDPTVRFGASNFTVLIMVGWFIICFFPGTGIANGAHTVGAVLGGLWGFLASGYLGRRRSRE